MSDPETCAVVTFKTICDAHSELLSAQAEEKLSIPKVIEFLDLAAAAGTQIESVAERIRCSKINILAPQKTGCEACRPKPTESFSSA
jgi:hypothetical protein